MSYPADPRVDAYIDTLPGWQQAICRELRDLIHAADPEVTETIKRTRQPYFVLDGNVCALLAARDHVNLFLYDGGITDDPAGIITAGHGNSTARTMAVRQDETVNAAALTAMLRAIIANNRAGGWRRIKARRLGRRRHADQDVKAPVGGIGHRLRRPVRAADRPDDRKAEPGAAARTRRCWRYGSKRYRRRCRRLCVAAIATAAFAAARHWHAVVSLPSLCAAVGVALAVGALAGLYPAVRAAQLPPAEALRLG